MGLILAQFSVVLVQPNDLGRPMDECHGKMTGGGVGGAGGAGVAGGAGGGVGLIYISKSRQGRPC